VIFNHGHEQSLSAHVVSLRDGAGAIDDTLREMVRIRDESKLDPRLRARVATLFLLLPDRDELAEIRTLFDYVRNRVRYLRDVDGIETVATPECTIRLQAGDCDDKSLALAALLAVAGYPTRFVAVGTSLPGWYEHVYVRVQLSDGSWLALDPTEQVPMGWEPGNVTAIMERG
jgi:transglutaminase-like putative cysteine protease